MGHKKMFRNSFLEQIMNESEIKPLFDAQFRRLQTTQLNLFRSLYPKINWQNRLICIKGAKGTGKTTMLLQHLKSYPEAASKMLYVSLDKLWFASHRVEDVVNYLYTHGFTHLFLDEVHHYPDWQTVIKNIYDDYPSMQFVYSGSSLLRLERGGGDLSRRQREYELPGLSFREYLKFEGVGDFPSVDLPRLLSDHRAIAEDIVAKVKILPYFSKYLKAGYYPFYREAGDGYLERLGRVVDQVLEVDLPAVENVTVSTVRKIRKMLMILAAKCPQTPKMKDLYAELETDRVKGLSMLQCLGRAGLMSLLSAEASSLKYLSRPDKIYCDNTNLMQALVSAVDTGTSRETFFLNQLKSAGHVVTLPVKGDFKVDDTWLFEVGGEGKGFNQIKDIKDSFVANDDTEIGIGNKIPLWLFGFLY